MNLRIERDGPLATLVFVPEKALNILTQRMLIDLQTAWRELEQSAVRVCILRGDGKVFLAGGDIRAMAGYTAADARAYSKLGQAVCDLIEHSPIVSIAAMHGVAVGGGLEVSLACDIRIGSDDLRIGEPEVNLGVTPGFGGSQRLPRVVGLGWALRMTLTGESIDAATALRIGLITDSGDPATLAERAETMARLILSRGPGAVVAAKRLVRLALNVAQPVGIAAEVEVFGQSFETGEAREGMRAFLEKRLPAFNPPRAPQEPSA